ncbi:MAG: hypothetical protein NTX22_16050 [Ignavibacteriales bacterium]|nr:hypothetical protein [Ignavibacteriales bacterium]
MKKKIYFIFALLLFIPGCLNYYQETTLKTDGSGEMFIHYWMKMATAQDSLIVNQFGIFNSDSISKEFTSKYNTIENLEVYNDGKDSTIHAKIELSFKNIDSLNNAKAFKEANFSLKDGAAGQKIFSQFISPAATGFGFDASLFSIVYVYYLPGEIITHNAHAKSSNKLTWKYKLSEIGMGKTITASYRPFKLKETPVWIFVLAILVLSVVIVFLFRKNKS